MFITCNLYYRFDIYLKSIPQNDNILQLSVRILDGYIAINSLENGIPGEEQLGETLPIKRAQGFEILILCDTDKYKVIIVVTSLKRKIKIIFSNADCN